MLCTENIAYTDSKFSNSLKEISEHFYYLEFKDINGKYLIAENLRLV